MSADRGGGWSEAIRSWLGRGAPVEGHVELARDAAWSAEVRGAPREVRCVQGVVLVTLEGDPADHLLSAGDAWITDRAGRLVVWALEAGRVWVSAPSASASSRAAPVRLAAAGARRDAR